MTTRADFATPETASLELAEVRRFGWARAAFAFLLTLVAVAVLVVAFVFGLAKAFEGKAMAGVAVAGVSVAGLDRAAAEARLREALPPLSQGKVTLSLEGRPTTIDYASIGRDYELGVMVDRAFTVGRTGNLLSQVSEGLRALVRGAAVEPVVRYDVAAVQRQVTAAAASVARAPVDASTRLAARSGTFVVSPSTDGSGVDEALAQVQVAQIISSTDAGNASISLTGRPIEPAVTTAEATAAAHQARAMTGGGLVLTVDNETFTVKTPTLQKWLAFGPTPDGGYRARVVPGRIQQTLETLVGEIDQAPRNARFRFSDTRVVGVIPGANGRQIDIARSTAKITEAMSAPSGTRRVALAITTAEPALTTAEAQAVAPRMQRISRWTVYYPVNEKNFWGKNITIPTSRINGYVVGPGEWFDFWKAVGSVSRSAGYGPGGAIINGRTEPTGALAGGICSCSTTLFNAAARAGLEIGARRNHYYYISRYPKGLDATVFRSSSGTTQTMSFRNDTPYPILIRGINGHGMVRFELYGVPTGRKVSFTRPYVRNYRNATDSVQYTTRLPPGVRDRVEDPVDGFDATVTRTVRGPDGAIIHRDTWFSRYAVITGILEIGVARNTNRNAGSRSGSGSRTETRSTTDTQGDSGGTVPGTTPRP